MHIHIYVRHLHVCTHKHECINLCIYINTYYMRAFWCLCDEIKKICSYNIPKHRHGHIRYTPVQYGILFMLTHTYIYMSYSNLVLLKCKTT